MSLFTANCSEDDAAGPVGHALISGDRFDRGVLVGGEADAEDFGACLAFGEGRPSGARAHKLSIAATGTLDETDLRGYDMCMSISEGQTFNLKGTGEITVSRIFTRNGETRVSVTGAARFTISAEALAELVEKVAA